MAFALSQENITQRWRIIKRRILIFHEHYLIYTTSGQALLIIWCVWYLLVNQTNPFDLWENIQRAETNPDLYIKKLNKNCSSILDNGLSQTRWSSEYKDVLESGLIVCDLITFVLINKAFGGLFSVSQSSEMMSLNMQLVVRTSIVVFLLNLISVLADEHDHAVSTYFWSYR